MRFFLACLLLAVSGCAPIIDSATPNSISIRSNPWASSAAEATAMAQAHCLKYDKNAELTSRNQVKGGAWALNFRCAN